MGRVQIRRCKAQEFKAMGEDSSCGLGEVGAGQCRKSGSARA